MNFIKIEQSLDEFESPNVTLNSPKMVDVKKYENNLSGTLDITSKFIVRKKALWPLVKIAINSAKLYNSKNDKYIRNHVLNSSIFTCRANRQKEEEQKHKLFIFSYKMKFYWEIMISFILCYSLFVLPFRILFQYEDSILELLIDIIIMTDTIYELVYDIYQQKTEILDIQKNFENLLTFERKFKFVIQLITCVPYQFIYRPLMNLKLLRIFDIRNIIKVITKAIKPIFLRSARYGNQIVCIISLVRNLIIFWYIIHITANYWTIISLSSTDESWIIYYKAIFFKKVGYEPRAMDIYIESIFFIVETFSTTGYGDVVGFSTQEYMYQIFTILFGIILYGILNSGMRFLVFQFGLIGKISNKKLDDIKFWLHSLTRNNLTSIPKSILINIDNLLTGNLKINSDDLFRNNEFFKKLSVKIQMEILTRVYSRFLIIFANYFHGLSEIFIFELLLQLDPKHCHNQILLKKNRKAKSLYFIIDDIVLVETKLNEKPLGYLDRGGIIGDDLILFDKKSKYTYRVTNYHSAFCFYLEKKKLIDLSLKFPHEIHKLKKTILIRISEYGDYKTIGNLFKRRNTIVENYIPKKILNSVNKINESKDGNSINEENKILIDPDSKDSQLMQSNNFIELNGVDVYIKNPDDSMHNTFKDIKNTCELEYSNSFIGLQEKIPILFNRISKDLDFGHTLLNPTTAKTSLLLREMVDNLQPANIKVKSPDIEGVYVNYIAHLTHSSQPDIEELTLSNEDQKEINKKFKTKKRIQILEKFDCDYVPTEEDNEPIYSKIKRINLTDQNGYITKK